MTNLSKRHCLVHALAINLVHLYRRQDFKPLKTLQIRSGPHNTECTLYSRCRRHLLGVSLAP